MSDNTISGNKRGVINIPFYRILLQSALAIPGAFCEIGVYKADTFKYIYEIARSDARIAVAFDSFAGMPEPVMSGDQWYYRGKFDTGGAGWFREMFPDTMVFEGYAPGVLNDISRHIKYAFIHLDIDHQDTTYETLPWCWSHLNEGGILVCHDYYPDREIQASKGIKRWMNETGIKPVGCVDSSIFFIKTSEAK